MSEVWSLFRQDETLDSDDELRKVFGEDAIISRVGKFNLIHLDNPGPEEVARRVEEFKPEDLFDDDCPLCKLLRDEGGNVVYDDVFGS